MLQQKQNLLYSGKRILAFVLSFMMIFVSVQLPVSAAATSVKLTTTEITAETTSVDIEIGGLPGSGILRVVQMDAGEAYDSSKLNSYTSLNFSLVGNLSEGKNTLELSGKPAEGKQILVILRDSTGDITDYQSEAITVKSAGSGQTDPDPDIEKTPAEILENCSVGLYKNGEIRTEKFKEDETSADVKVQLDDSVESCYLTIYAYPGNAAFDPDNNVSKRLWSGQVTNGYSGTCTFNESLLPLIPGYKIIASLNVPVGEDYYLPSNSQAIEVVDENGEGFKDYVYPDVTIDEETLEAGATSLHLTLTGDERIFQAAKEGKTDVIVSVGMYPVGDNFDFESADQISLQGNIRVTEAFSGKEITFTQPLQAGYRVRAVVYWSQNEDIFLPKGNDYEAMFGKPDDSVLVTAPSNDPKVTIQEDVYIGAASCKVELSGDIPEGAMMSVKSYPKGSTDIAYDKGTVQKFLTSVNSGVNSIEFNDPDGIVEGTILVAYLIKAGEPVAQSAKATVKKVPAPEVAIKGKITTESTTVPVEVTGNVPNGVKIILFTFAADATEFPRDYSVGSFLKSYTDEVAAGTTEIAVENLEKGRQIVAYLVDSSFQDLAQSSPVPITEKTDELSVTLGEITTSSKTVDVEITGDLPEGSMILVKSYTADVTEYSYTVGNPHGVTQAENISAGTVTHTLTNTDNLIKGRKAVAFLLNGGSPIAVSEPVVITQGAYMTPEIEIVDKEITAGDTKLNFKASFDKAIDSANYAVYSYTGNQFNKSDATQITSATIYRSSDYTAYIAQKIKEDDKLVVVLTVDGKDYISDPITVQPSPDWGTPTASFNVDSISDEATEIPIKVDYADEYTQMNDYYCNITVYMFDNSVDDDVFAEDEYWEKTDKVSVVATANAGSGDVTKGEFNIKVLNSANLQAGKKLIIKVRLPHTEWEGEEEDFLSSSIQIRPSSQIAQGPSVLLYKVDFGSERGNKIKALLEENNIAYKMVDDADLNQTIGYLVEKKGYSKNDESYTGETFNTEFMLMNDADEKELYKLFVDDGGFIDKMADAGVSIPHKAIITATNQEWILSELIEKITEEHATMTGWVALNKLAETADQFTEEKYGKAENWSSYQQILSEVQELLKKEEPEAEELQQAYDRLSSEISKLKEFAPNEDKPASDIDSGSGSKASEGNSTTSGNSGTTTTTTQTPAVNTARVTAGKSYKYSGQTFKVVKAASGKNAGTVTFTKAKNAKSVTVPKTIKLADNKTYKVISVGEKAFTAKKIRTVTIGANVSKINKNTFARSKVTKVVLKTKLLKKASVKGSLKGSKVKIVQVKVGSKKVNKKIVKTYKKIFTKKIAGKKVTVK